MKELLNRSNPIYKEIEQFKDYEFTNCIAYEMAIRNNEVFKIDEEQSRVNYNLKDFEIDEDIKKEILDFSILDDYMKKSYANFLEKKIEKSQPPTKKDIFNHLKVFLRDKGPHLVDYEQLYKDYGDLINYKDFSTKTKKYLIEKSFELRPKIIEEFSRPTLKIENTFKIDMIINPNLPKDELIAYISKIKDEYDKNNSIIKSPLELLGEELDKSEEIKSKALPKDKEKRKKTMADAFYIYDTWKILEIHYAEKTKELKEKLKKDIQDAKHKPDYKSVIDTLKINNEIDLNNYTKVSLKTEIASQLNISIDTVDKLHTLMIKYIDNLKYKELITGLSN
jgi:hypothetical protein